LISGEWSGTSAGGCKNFATWVENPKFKLTTFGPCTINVVLCQSDKLQLVGIGFYILEDILKSDLKALTLRHGSSNKVITKSKFVTALEAFSEVNIAKGGNYVVVPATFEPGVQDKFDLAIYSKSDFDFQADQ